MSERAVVEQGFLPDLLARLAGLGRKIFLAGGILPIVLIIAIVGFAIAEPRFLTYNNLFNVARASSFLVVVSIGQMLTLLVRGIDMSIGSTEALVSVCVALVMATVLEGNPNAIWLSIAAGMAAGVAIGALVGAVTGLGIAVFNVNPFIMTVGMLSILSGVALTISGGMPMYGMPKQFGETFAYAAPLGIPAPVWAAGGVFLVMYYVLNWTPFGRRIYALGGNIVASRLAGISTRLHMVMAYVMCSIIVAVGGILLTARVGTGEATLASTHVLESITAVVIAGVSFFGGIGRVGNVVLGAFFVTLVTNGMNLLRVPSYQQLIVLGVLLILAVVVDQVRIKMMQQVRAE